MIGRSDRAPEARRGRALVAAALALPIVVGVTWVLGPKAREPVPRPATPASRTTSATPVTPSADMPAPDVRRLAATFTPPAEREPPRHDAVPDESGHPHPLTPAHARIFEENDRIAGLNDALDRGDSAALRRLNARYREAYPEDSHVLQQGYDLIADCLEGRSRARVDAARRFWEERRASSLRRYVRRYCLGDRAASP